MEKPFAVVTDFKYYLQALRFSVITTQIGHSGCLIGGLRLVLGELSQDFWDWSFCRGLSLDLPHSTFQERQEWI